MENSYIFIRSCRPDDDLCFGCCASTQQKESTGKYFDDSVITTKIKAKLAKDDFLKSFQIRVESRKGVVQFSGFVDWQTLIHKAVEVAEEVKGSVAELHHRRIRHSLTVPLAGTTCLESTGAAEEYIRRQWASPPGGRSETLAA